MCRFYTLSQYSKLLLHRIHIFVVSINRPITGYRFISVVYVVIGLMTVRCILGFNSGLGAYFFKVWNWKTSISCWLLLLVVLLLRQYFSSCELVCSNINLIFYSTIISPTISFHLSRICDMHVWTFRYSFEIFIYLTLNWTA